MFIADQQSPWEQVTSSSRGLGSHEEILCVSFHAIVWNRKVILLWQYALRGPQTMAGERSRERNSEFYEFISPLFLCSTGGKLLNVFLFHWDICHCCTIFSCSINLWRLSDFCLKESHWLFCRVNHWHLLKVSITWFTHSIITLEASRPCIPPSIGREETLKGEVPNLVTYLNWTPSLYLSGMWLSVFPRMDT